ncbi:MAG: CsgG/HfaB family protein [Myxococcales bacterium]|nr:CsgG/HfaB family protein [Myxococcales bacterium]
MFLLICGADAADLRVAVVEFDNAADTDDLDALGKGLQSMITSDLAQVSELQLVERARLDALRAELALSQSELTDPETAARLGKLAGATHLLAGTYTVVGERMRLDARLFAVETADVVLSADVQGERQAFFELEKDLVAQLVRAVDVELSPKERAGVARIHTADFDAFVSFSEGIALFDEARYDAALDRLKRATAADEDFKLARLTLQSYTDIVADLRRRASDLSRARAEIAQVQLEGAAAEQAQVVQRLHQIAQQTGPTHQRDRLTALYLLASAHQRPDTHMKALGTVSDAFALARAGERYAQAYLAEARALFPACPLAVDHYASRGLPPLDRFDELFALHRKALFPPRGEMSRDHLRELSNLVPFNVAALYLDSSERARLLDEVLTAWQSADLEPPRPHDWRRLSELYRAVLELDRSTAVLRGLAAGSDDEGWVRSIARDIERNGELQARLQQVAASDTPFTTYEAMTVLQKGRGIVQRSHDWLGDPDHREVRFVLNGVRSLHHREHRLVDGHPIWVLLGQRVLHTGPRTDDLRGQGLRFGGNDRARSLAVVDGVPRSEVRATFTIDTRPARDWWPTTTHPRSHRDFDPQTTQMAAATVSFVFGLRDVDTPGKRPASAWMVRLRPDALQVVRTVESLDDPPRLDDWDDTVLFESPLPAPPQRQLSVDVGRDAVVVTVDGAEHRIEISGLQPGFQGLMWTGPGYAEVRDLSVRAP